MPKKIIKTDSYKDLVNKIQKELDDLGLLIKQSTVRAYWNIGKYISEHILENQERAGYGERLYEWLAEDLSMSKRSLARTVQFYRTYPILPNLAKLGWSHFIWLMSVKDESQRKLLEAKALKGNWSITELKKQIEALKQKERLEETGVIPQLEWTKGRLGIYKIVESEEIPNKDKQLLVDCGFQLRREFPEAKKFNLKDGDCVEIIREDDSFDIKKVSISEEEMYAYVAYVQTVIDGDTLWALIDTFDGAKPRLSRRGSKAPLSINPESFDVTQDASKDAELVEAQTPGFSPGCVEWVDCGFGMYIRQKLRFRGIDCPELPTPEGLAAKKFVQNKLKDLDFIIIKSYKDSTDKYDRYLVDIFYLAEEDEPQKVLENGVFLNQELLDKGLARLF